MQNAKMQNAKMQNAKCRMQKQMDRVALAF
jgi:hypothetical protein